jgi:fermentation-respiration switch protein FrsA (DUF1100 family)
MRTMALGVSSATSIEGGTPTPWPVDQLTRKVFVRSLTAGLGADEAELLRTACADRLVQTDIEALSADGRAIYPLLTGLDVSAAEQALGGLPGGLRDRLDAMSPIDFLAAIRAPLLLLAHDRDDTVIPVAESRRLIAALSGRPGVRYTEFTLFKHLDPTKVRLPPLALARELGKFVRSVYPMFRQVA